MKRLDWQLVPPARPGRLVEVVRLRAAADDLMARATRELLDDEEIETLAALEAGLEQETLSTCEAVDAPKVEDDPDWEHRAIDEYDEADIDMEIEDFLAIRRTDPDCERCPYASPYSVFPMDPCEFSAGPLAQVVGDAALAATAARPLDPDAMLALAGELEAVLAAGSWVESAVLDPVDFLEKAVYFLRFWARLGFHVAPVDPDALPPIQTIDGPAGGPGESGQPPPLLH